MVRTCLYSDCQRHLITRRHMSDLNNLHSHLKEAVRRGGRFMYRQFNIQQSSRSAHTVSLCVLCGSENKLLQGDQKVSVHLMITIQSLSAQRLFDNPLLFPYTALTDWFL